MEVVDPAFQSTSSVDRVPPPEGPDRLRKCSVPPHSVARLPWYDVQVRVFRATGQPLVSQCLFIRFIADDVDDCTISEMLKSIVIVQRRVQCLRQKSQGGQQERAASACWITNLQIQNVLWSLGNPLIDGCIDIGFAVGTNRRIIGQWSQSPMSRGDANCGRV